MVRQQLELVTAVHRRLSVPARLEVSAVLSYAEDVRLFEYMSVRLSVLNSLHRAPNRGGVFAIPRGRGV